MNCNTHAKLILKNIKYSLILFLQTSRPYLVLFKCLFYYNIFVSVPCYLTSFNISQPAKMKKKNTKKVPAHAH